MIRKIRRAPSKDREGAKDVIITIDIPGYERALIARATDRGMWFRGERNHKEVLVEWPDLGSIISRQWGWRELLGRRK